MLRIAITPILVLLLTAMSLAPVYGAEPTPRGERSRPAETDRARFVEVVDGDTIRVRLDGEAIDVRLIGIDAPDVAGTGAAGECFGAEASDHLERMLTGRTVWLEQDRSDEDDSGRRLRHVWFKGKTDNRYYLVGEVLVRRGYAVVQNEPPDVGYADRLTEAEEAAVDDGLGLWATCGGADTPLAQENQEPVTEPAPIVDPVLTDCEAFVSFDAANAYYAGRPDAQPYLDPNADGRACEVWFGVDAPPVVESPTPSNGGGGGGGGGGGTSGGGPIYTDFGGLDGVDYDCYDFPSPAAAQAYFNADGGSIYNNADGLDRNHNGLACEPGEFD